MSVSPEDVFNHRLATAADVGIPIGGSIGRAAILGDPTISAIRANGSMRDIDVVDVGQHTARAHQLPSEGYDHIWLSPFLRKIDGEVELGYPGIYSGIPEVPPQVSIKVPYLDQLLEPQGYRTINGQPCLVLKDEAQLALDKMRGRPHPKNNAVMQRMERRVAAIPPSAQLDPEILEPFIVFGREIDNLLRVKVYRFARFAYHTFLPNSVSQSFLPKIQDAARKGRLI